MNTLVRFNDTIINVAKLVWMGINTTTSGIVLLFRFENSANDITFTYLDINTARLEMARFEGLVKALQSPQSGFGSSSMFGTTGFGSR